MRFNAIICHVSALSVKRNCRNRHNVYKLETFSQRLAIRFRISVADCVRGLRRGTHRSDVSEMQTEQNRRGRPIVCPFNSTVFCDWPGNRYSFTFRFAREEGRPLGSSRMYPGRSGLIEQSMRSSASPVLVFFKVMVERGSENCSGR